MATELRVEIPERSNCAEAVREVVGVCVGETTRAGAEVDSGAGEDAAAGVPPEEGVASVELAEG